MTLLLAALACAPKQPQLPEQQVVEAPAEGALTLVEPGGWPRRPLRYRLTAQEEATLIVELAMDLTMELGGLERAFGALPVQVMTVDAEILEADRDRVRIQQTVSAVEVRETEDSHPEMVTQTREQAEALQGMTCTYELDRLGASSDLQCSGEGADVAPGLPAFPEERVGVGAVWTSERHTRTQGLAVVERTAWTLVSRDGDLVVLAFETTQALAEPSAEGSDVVIHSFEGGSQGQHTLDLSQPLSPTSESTSRVSMSSTVQSEGVFLDSSMALEVRVQTQPVEPE